MFKLLCILNFIILVTPNPLQGATTCPLASYQPNYLSEIPLSSNFIPYQQQNTVRYRLAPSIQTVPHSYNGQLSGYYLDNGLTNTQTSSLVNPIRIYDQDGFDLKYYVPNTNRIPNVVNNYIIVPPEYIKLNLGNGNVLQSHNVNKNNKYVKENSHKEKVKCKREENVEVRDTYCSNFENTLVDSKSNNSLPRKILRSQDNNKKIKKSKNADNNSQMSESPKRENNSDAGKDEKGDNIEEHKSNRKGNKKSKKNKNSNKNSKIKEKTKSISKDPKHEIHEGIVSRDKVKDDKKTADVEVCFDINEECACLENRKPRNNCYEPKINYQQQFPRGFSENIVSYLNNIMSNPQFSSNYLNSFGNFPYNFDYLFQIPQKCCKCSNNSNKCSKNNRKNSKSNKTGRKCKSNNGNSTTAKQNENKNQNHKGTSKECKQIVALEPQFINIEETKPIIPQETTKSLEERNDKTVKETDLKELEQEILEIPQVQTDTESIKFDADDDSNETVYVAPVLNENDFPNVDSNEVIDDYYPDFRADNIYLSKEEYEYNFHDRHYYNSDNKAEMSIERSRYEHIDGKNLKHFNDVINDVTDKHVNKKSKQKKNHVNNMQISSELEFRTPPPLQFPDFKTEMINRDQFTSRSEIHDQPDESDNENDRDRAYHYQTPIYAVKESNDLDLNHKNGVETVYAHSKVIKYGSTPSVEEKLTVNSKETKNGDKNLFSTDGKTTVIIARSLGYPEDY
ncbi:unnamed protein product [Euphydryas editha]|uniref:Uncharacterized protein n=1 Tax=Euphydryas editha TaxID=104508 RepID=A0AAU9T8B6_EUPED|nr:unnamed protein product [Euphydryas editha]